jgi:hypothetical protein
MWVDNAEMQIFEPVHEEVWRYYKGGSAQRNLPFTEDRTAGYALLCNPSKCYISQMTTAEDIEKAVEQLAPPELARFRAWFEAFDAEQFDAAVERDISAGKLDVHADEAVAAHRAPGFSVRGRWQL